MTQNPFLTSKKPFSVNFASPADTGRVVDGKVLRQSVLYEPNLPRTPSLTEFTSVLSVTSVAKLPKLTLLSVFSEELFSDTSLSQVTQVTKSIKKNLFMQNKPNLCVFWAVNGDCEEKQTQFKPKFYPPRPCGGQTQNKANFDLSAPIKAKTNPIQTQTNPIPAGHAIASPNAGYATQNLPAIASAKAGRLLN